VSLGGGQASSGGAGPPHGDAAWELALRQGVADLLEVLAELVLAEGGLDAAGGAPGDEMPAILLLQLVNLRTDGHKGRPVIHIQYIHTYIQYARRGRFAAARCQIDTAKHTERSEKNGSICQRISHSVFLFPPGFPWVYMFHRAAVSIRGEL